MSLQLPKTIIDKYPVAHFVSVFYNPSARMSRLRMQEVAELTAEGITDDLAAYSLPHALLLGPECCLLTVRCQFPLLLAVLSRNFKAM